MNIIERILLKAKEKGLNQSLLAQHLSDFGVTKQTITDWKTSKSNSYYYLIADIANILNVSCDYLLIGKESGSERSEAEIKLLEKYSKLSDGEQQEVIGYINCLLAHHIEVADSETA